MLSLSPSPSLDHPLSIIIPTPGSFHCHATHPSHQLAFDRTCCHASHQTSIALRSALPCLASCSSHSAAAAPFLPPSSKILVLPSTPQSLFLTSFHAAIITPTHHLLPSTFPIHLCLSCHTAPISLPTPTSFCNFNIGRP